MSRRFAFPVAVVLTARLALAPFAGAEPDGDRSIGAAAAREAARLASAPARGPMPAGLKWTGVGLLAGSGLPVLAANFGDCLSDESSCRDQRHAAYAVGGAMAATGVLLLVIADAKRPALPSVGVHDGRVFVAQRLTF